jgi:sugar phosphate isomerase/epimerase
MGNSLLIVPGLKEEHRSSIQAWKRTAGLFNDIASKIKKHGLRVGYHHHTVEFVKMDGQVPFELFLDLTTPEVLLQLDTGLAEEAGADAVALLKKHPGRGLTIHAKEYSRTRPDAFIGEGDVKWAEILRTCAAVSGTEWYILEYERPKGVAVENVRICLENFRRILKAGGISA